VVQNSDFNNETEQGFVGHFLWKISETKNFDFTLEFLQDKEKEKIKALINALDKIGEERQNGLRKAYLIKS